MKRVIPVASVLVVAVLVAGCASARTAGQAGAAADHEAAERGAFETGWQRPDPTGTAFFKPAVSGGSGVVSPW